MTGSAIAGAGSPALPCEGVASLAKVPFSEAPDPYARRPRLLTPFAGSHMLRR